MSETAAEAPEARASARMLAVVTAWFAISAFAQLGFLARWPMSLAGVPLPWVLGGAVALVRLGIYAGLACGLAERQRGAWTAAILELLRSTILFIAVLALHREMRGALYPAPWMQGVLTGFLPLVMLCNSALAAGWSPGGDLELRFSQGVRIGVALLFLTGLALRRHGARFGVPGLAGWKTVFREGAAPVGLLCVVEAAAAAIALAV